MLLETMPVCFPVAEVEKHREEKQLGEERINSILHFLTEV